MYNHGCLTCLAMVYHGKLLKTETMRKHSQRGGTHLSEGLTGLAEKTKEQTIKQ